MKIICPYHDDTQPSMEVYEEYAHCFSCGAHVSNDKIGVKNAPAKKLPTDIKKMLEYIQTLPIRRVRGLELPVDERGFYIVWPNGTYYKRRNWKGQARYTGPRGIKPPLMLYECSTLHIVVIEGEINTLTVMNYINIEPTIASPGAASEFIRHIDEYIKYEKITLILDHDASGVAFGLQCKEMLLKAGKSVTLITRTKDYNDVLQQDNTEVLRLEFEKDINGR